MSKLASKCMPARFVGTFKEFQLLIKKQMKVNGIPRVGIDKSRHYSNAYNSHITDYLTFDIVTCDTIKESLASFDLLEEKIKRKAWKNDDGE